MHRTRLNKVSQPNLRFQGWKAMNLGSKIAVIILALIALLAIFAPLIAPHDPGATNLSTRETVVHIEGIGDQHITDTCVPPSSEFIFGTDGAGRDVFSRLVYGARISLIVGLSSTLLALVISGVLGAIAATARKWVAEILMRTLDVLMSFPGIALAAVLVLALSASLPKIPVIIVAIAILYVPQLTRVVRANILTQFGEDYVAASKVMGAKTGWILLVHVARNCIAPIMVFATVLVADAIVFEASLSFIGAGISSVNAATWGNMLSEGKEFLLTGHWWTTFFPGLMILITTLCLNVLSEGLTDAMASPKVRSRANVEADEKAMKLEGTKQASAEETIEGMSSLSSLVRPASSDIPLEQRLEMLRKVELERDDRLIYGATNISPILEVKDLSIAFPAQHGEVDIVDRVSFSVRPGETMGLVGESGCGKSITSMAVMGLLPPTARIGGQILFKGKDLLTLTAQEHNALRGHGISMIYQDALSSLNPSMLISAQMKQLTSRGGKRSAEELLRLVGLDPIRTLKSYPHELSGGQRQRVLIAMALTRDPSLVIADEPTTALDVTVQEQVVELLNDLRTQLGFAMVFVSHDLALVAKLAHSITVMYAGQVVEQGTTAQILTNPCHEYTQGLLGAVLSIESGSQRLHQVPGTVPSPREFVAGDRFAPRSSHPTIGLNTRPHLVEVANERGHRYATTTDMEELLAKEGQR